VIHPSKIIKELGISPLKKLGQNFQIDTHVVENAAHRIPADAQILEIGPGLGAWTEVFLKRGHAMVLAEKDRTLAARLAKLHHENPNVQVLEGDFLEVDVMQPPVNNCTVAVGNLPFYVTSELLLRLIVDCAWITHGLFGVQLEVAERLAGGKGSSLAIALGSQGKIGIAGKISRNSFYPAPNVDAALIFFTREATLPRPHLRLLLKAAFWGKRKTLGTALKKNPFWSAEATASSWPMKIERLPAVQKEILTRRADDLSIAEFTAFYDMLQGD
jgi:16S rRNA (adenine1518-N6/adenine1519-N6)-dimethyltransferase